MLCGLACCGSILLLLVCGWFGLLLFVVVVVYLVGDGVWFSLLLLS